jgi:hypothetical protein
MYLPFMKQKRMLNMGLHPLTPTEWIEPDIEWEDFHTHKLHCFKNNSARVLRTLPSSGDAQKELRDMLSDHLLTDHSETFSCSGHTLTHLPTTTSVSPSPDMPPIQEASLWIQDDLCLLENSPEGYRLTAASLCSPSYWHLEEKIGKTLHDIHAPVPGYATTLSKPVDSFFDRLAVDQPVWRLNWTVTAHDGLMQRFDPPTPGDPDHDPLWLRVERQTLTRLPKTNAVCFTIRIHRYPLDDVLADPTREEAFQQALHSLSPEEKTYKSLASVYHRLTNI